MTTDEHWVFGYGSLMWRPGFAFLERAAATLHGRRRAFCIYSVHHRGTPERRGLVLGLAAGGATRTLCATQLFTKLSMSLLVCMVPV